MNVKNDTPMGRRRCGGWMASMPNPEQQQVQDDAGADGELALQRRARCGDEEAERPVDRDRRAEHGGERAFAPGVEHEAGGHQKAVAPLRGNQPIPRQHQRSEEEQERRVSKQ
jgi:hypothetical protein